MKSLSDNTETKSRPEMRIQDRCITVVSRRILFNGLSSCQWLLERESNAVEAALNVLQELHAIGFEIYALCHKESKPGRIDSLIANRLESICKILLYANSGNASRSDQETEPASQKYLRALKPEVVITAIALHHTIAKDNRITTGLLAYSSTDHQYHERLVQITKDTCQQNKKLPLTIEQIKSIRSESIVFFADLSGSLSSDKSNDESDQFTIVSSSDAAEIAKSLHAWNQRTERRTVKISPKRYKESTGYVNSSVQPLAGPTKKYSLSTRSSSNEKSIEVTIPIQGKVLTIATSLCLSNGENLRDKQAVLLAEFFDQNNNKIDFIPKNFSHSTVFDAAFRYILTSEKTSIFKQDIHCSPKSRFIRLTIKPFVLAESLHLLLNSDITFEWQRASNQAGASKEDRQQAVFVDLPFDRPLRATNKPRIASILDTFSDACFSSLADLQRISPGDWEEEMSSDKPDFLLVESAWHGNDDEWLYGIASYKSPPHDELLDLIQWCKRNDVPTVFWNKEDPVNFNRFSHRAPLFDYILTTDSNCIPLYQKICPNALHIGSLMFAANPDIHHPIRDTARIHGSFFAGSYYADEHDDRRIYMDIMLNQAAKHGLTFYDRMSDCSADQRHRFAPPQNIRSFIKPKVSYADLCRLYSQYRVGLNVNSILNSPTMFSRRVFEMLASGTPTLSTPSLGIEKVFSGIVPIVKDDKQTLQALETLIYEDDRWIQASVSGWRMVNSQHTYHDRINQILSMLNINSKGINERLLIMIVLESAADPSGLISLINSSSKKPDLIIVAQSQVNKGLAQNLGKSFMPSIRAIEVSPEIIPAMLKTDYSESITLIMSPETNYNNNYISDAWYFSRRSDNVIAPSSAIQYIHEEETSYDYGFGYKILGKVSLDTVACQGNAQLVDKAIYYSMRGRKSIDLTSDQVYQRPRG